MSSSATSSSRDKNELYRRNLDRFKSISELSVLAPIFHVNHIGKISCKCCLNQFKIPPVVRTANGFSRQWLDLRKSLRRHLTLPDHQSKSTIYYYQEEFRNNTFVSEDRKAGIILIRMVYENIMTGRSYASFPISVATRYLEGAFIGFQNHSAAFPPKIVDCIYEVLHEKVVSYFTTRTPFGWIHFGITCDKDTSKGRSRQMTGIRYVSFDDNLDLPFIQTSYIGHPVCSEFTGHYLATKIRELLRHFGILNQQVHEGYSGTNADGQYLNLQINRHIRDLHGLGPNDRATLNVWDGSHIIELIFKHAKERSPTISRTLKAVHAITGIMKSKCNERLIRKCNALNLDYKTLKLPKDLKFIKHSLVQLKDFVHLKPAIIEILQEDGLGGDAQSGFYVRTITYPSFDLTLAFTIDVVSLLSKFSLKFQAKRLFIHNYYNLIDIMRSCLNNIKLENPPTTMDLDQKYVFRSFCDVVSRGVQSYHSTVQRYSLRNAVPVHRFDPAIQAAVNACNRFTGLLVSYTDAYWFAHGYWETSTRQLLPQVSMFMNFLMDDVSCIKPSFITDDKDICMDCDRFVLQKDQAKHTTQFAGHNVFLSVPSLVPNFRIKKGPLDITLLRELLPASERHHLTENSMRQLKQGLSDVKLHLNAKKIPITLDSICKLFFNRRSIWDRCLKGVLNLLLHILTIPASEAFMESIGSIVEHYHKRFTLNDVGTDDKRLSKELFIRMNGPPLIIADSLIEKTLDKYYASGHHTFAHERTLAARLPSTSLTLKRLKEEALKDSNRNPNFVP